MARYSIIVLALLISTFSFGQDEVELLKLMKQADELFIDEPQKAIEIAKNILDKSDDYPKIQIESLLFLSYSHSILEEYSISIEYALKAEELAKINSNPNTLAVVLTELGNLYHLLKINQKANRYFDEAESLIALQDFDRSLYYIKGNINSMKGNAYKDDFNNKDLAISYYNKAIYVYLNSKSKEKSLINLKVAYLNKAFSFVDLNNLDSAKYSFQQAEKLKLDNYADFINIGQSQIFLKEGKLDEAILSLNKSVSVMDNFHKSFLMPTVYQTYSKIYLEKGDFEKHRNNQLLYQQNWSKYQQNEQQSYHKIIDQISIQGTKKIMKEKSEFIFWMIPLSILLLSIIIFFFIRIRMLFLKIKLSKQTILKYLTEDIVQ